MPSRLRSIPAQLLALVFAGAGADAVLPAASTTPQLLGAGVISTGSDDSHASLYPDGSELYFLRNTPSFDFYTIVCSEWLGTGWKPPRTVPFSGQYSDADIAFTADGRRAYFVSTRPVDGTPRSDMEIWTVERDEKRGWGEPHHVAELSSPEDEWFPTLTADGTIYFGSSRHGGKGGYDIWRAKFAGDKFQRPENLGAPVNTAADEVEPFVTSDERILIFSAKNRPDGIGAYDLYVARRANDRWETPGHPDPPINSVFWDFAPRLSPDGAVFFFTSNRGFGSEPLGRRLELEDLERKLHAPGNGLRDIYYVRTEAILPP